MREVQGFKAFHVIEIDPSEVVLVIVADAAETLDRIASEVGNAWMRDNVLPHLAEPPSRRIGTVLASSDSD